MMASAGVQGVRGALEASCHCDKIPEQILFKEERFIWLRVSEVAVCGQLAPLLFG
jgi:hypothetical protein